MRRVSMVLDRLQGSGHAVGVAAWLVGLLALCRLIDRHHYGDDAIVLATFVLLNGGGRRAAIGLLAILLFAATFPPLAWPLYWVCFAPMAWLWRTSDVPGRGWLGEAFGVGFSMCWLTSPFVRSDYGDWGIAIQGFASPTFALQVVGIAASLRDEVWSAFLAAPAVALVATAIEVLRVSILRWPLLVLAFRRTDSDRSGPRSRVRSGSPPSCTRSISSGCPGGSPGEGPGTGHPRWRPRPVRFSPGSEASGSPRASGSSRSPSRRCSSSPIASSNPGRPMPLGTAKRPSCWTH